MFSPLTPEGRPRPLFDRKTGAVDAETVRGWEKYDIVRVLETNWTALKPKLSGKIHVYVGGMDTFYLDGAVKLLKASQEKLGSDAVIELIPGKDHSTVLNAELVSRMDREMLDAVKAFRKTEK